MNLGSLYNFIINNKFTEHETKYQEYVGFGLGLQKYLFVVEIKKSKQLTYNLSVFYV